MSWWLLGPKYAMTPEGSRFGGVGKKLILDKCEMPLGGLDARNGLKLRRDTRKGQGAKIGFAGLMEEGAKVAWETHP